MARTLLPIAILPASASEAEPITIPLLLAVEVLPIIVIG